MGCDNRLLVKLIELGCVEEAVVDGTVVAVFLVAGDDAMAELGVVGGGSPPRPRLAALARNLLPAWDGRPVEETGVRLLLVLFPDPSCCWA